VTTKRFPGTDHTSQGAAILCLILAAALLWLPGTAQASQAVVVEIYQNCELVDTNVVIDEQALSAGDSAEVKARVARASRDTQMAVPRIVQILKNYGIADVSVSQQGLAGCEPTTSGKFVEAVGSYCGAELRRAEIFVDRQSFMSTTDPDSSFEEFLRRAVERLRAQEIYDRPIVSIENAPNCDASS